MLLRASPLAMFQMTLFLSLMGGSSALVLTALGGSTVQPAILALAFLVLKCALPRTQQEFRVGQAFRAFKYLLLFVLYGIAAAQILPRIFARSMDVAPLRPIPNGNLFAAYPLEFSSQNITVSVYLLATLFAGICAYIVCNSEQAEIKLARTASIISATHALLGLSGVAFSGTAWSSVLSFFRNANYAQLEQTLEGVVRMNGIWPEPSVFSVYGFSWLVFNSELWLRNIERRWTGCGALLMVLALVISTSTTAYLGLAAYSLLIVLRIGFFPNSVSMRNGMILVAGGFIALAALLTLVVVAPGTYEALSEFAAKLTINKADSASALQRGFWARQGIEAFIASWGLGIGPGSFRSSSLATAILGSVGILGTTAFTAHLITILKPINRSTYDRVTDPRLAVGVSASWSAIILLVPMLFSSASPDPGIIWGFFSGIALALRHQSPLPIEESSQYLAKNGLTVARL